MNYFFMNSAANDAKLEERQGFLKRIFGCWHSRMSRPVTLDNITYCYCKDCGLRRRYDINSGRTHGAFYSERPLKSVYFV